MLPFCGERERQTRYKRLLPCLDSNQTSSVRTYIIKGISLHKGALSNMFYLQLNASIFINKGFKNIKVKDKNIT